MHQESVSPLEEIVEKNSRIRSLEQKPFWAFLGLIFALSFVCFFYYAWSRITPENLARLLPDSAALVVELDISQMPEDFSSTFSEDHFAEIFPDVFSVQHLQKFAGSHVSMVYLEDSLVPEILIQVLKPRASEHFLAEHFLIEGEGFRFLGEDIFTPEFSSDYYFAYKGGYLLVGRSEKRLREILDTESLLVDDPDFMEIFQDLPSQGFIKTFVASRRAESLIEHFLSQNFDLPILQPLGKTFYQALPSGGMVINFNDRGEIEVRNKFLTHDAIYKGETLKNPTSYHMPQTSALVPGEVIFYQNGFDLYQKYLQTKKFLGGMHEDLPAIFDAALRAQTGLVFGDKFDHEQDFLRHFDGEYALVVNFSDETYPFLHYTFLSELSGADREKLLGDFHEAIHTAQSHNEIGETQVILPSTRRVSALEIRPEAEVFLRKIEQGDQHYFSINNPATGMQFSYGIVDNFFVISSHEEGLRQVLATQNSVETSLKNNRDFSYKVHQVFTPSESYLYLNNRRLQQALDLVRPVEGESENTSEELVNSLWMRTLGSFFSERVNLLISNKKVFPEALFFEGIFSVQ